MILYFCKDLAVRKLAPSGGMGVAQSADHLLNIYFNLGANPDFKGALQIFDTAGRLVYSEAVNGSQQMFSLNTSEWSSGVYQCIVSSKNDVWKGTIEIIH
jgi:hypothetical protein